MRTTNRNQFDGDLPAASFRRRGWPLYLLLLVSCLIPRAAMAWKLDALCNDAVFYVELASHFERGDLSAGFGRLGLNTFPPVLAVLHRLGLDWESAGKLWGVAMASLAVLPLYGWVRRQFDERIGLVAALLYAFHPKLIEWSPELVRDPTFWFLALLSLYLSWRAASEGRLAWFAAAGTAIALAAHTRFEGWLLFIPVIGWSLFRWRDRLPWPRTAARLALCGAVTPLLLLSLNLTVLHHEANWQLGNFERLQYIALWAAEWLPAQTNATEVVNVPESDSRFSVSEMASFGGASGDITMPQPVASERLSPGRMAWLYINALRRAFGALFGLSWLISFAIAPRRWLRGDHGVLFLFAGGVAAAAWIHLWYGQATSSRYFLTMVLVAFPCTAAGWLWVVDHAIGFAGRLNQARWPRFAMATVAVVVTLTAGIAESLADRHDGRSREAVLGRWLLAELGPTCRIGTLRRMPLIGYYARGEMCEVSQNSLGSLANDGVPLDAFVAVRRHSPAVDSSMLTSAAGDYGLREVDRTQLPTGFDWSDVVVMLRSDLAGDRRR